MNLEGIQVGDPVWQRSMDRWGKVKSIYGNLIYVDFESVINVWSFTLDGKSCNTHEVPDLFFDKIPEPEYPKRPIMFEGTPLKVGDVVYHKFIGDELEVIFVGRDAVKIRETIDQRQSTYALVYYVFADNYTRTKPKRKVKKTVECWSNVYHDHDSTYRVVSYFSSREKALKHAGKGAIQVKLTGEYEVEE